jgi:hypothetical protein
MPMMIFDEIYDLSKCAGDDHEILTFNISQMGPQFFLEVTIFAPGIPLFHISPLQIQCLLYRSIYKPVGTIF